MKAKIFYCSLFFTFLLTDLRAQTIDTLVDIGTHKMHFYVWEGVGTPILFESGGGNDGSIWIPMANDLHNITGATIIAYDRVGYGQSELDPSLPDDKKSLITHGVDALTKGLQKLGYFEDLIFVAHSYGAYYANYFSAKNPTKVKGVVLIDGVTSCFHSDEFLAFMEELRTDEWLENIRSQSEALYYECLAATESIHIMKDYRIPDHISVTNLVAENPPYDNDKQNEEWKKCHQEFSNNHPNCVNIVASNCGHYLHFDNPTIAFNAIVKHYSQANKDVNHAKILERHLSHNSEVINKYREDEYDYWHSERELNAWGYSLLSEENTQAALQVFKLNTELHPDGFNTWDSYGEILLMLGDKVKAKEMYEKSLELNPDNEHAKEVLKGIKE